MISCHQRPETKRHCASFNCRLKLIFVLLLQGFYFSPFTNSINAEEQAQAKQCASVVGKIKICTLIGCHLSGSISVPTRRFADDRLKTKCSPRHKRSISYCVARNSSTLYSWFLVTNAQKPRDSVRHSIVGLTTNFCSFVPRILFFSLDQSMPRARPKGHAVKAILPIYSTYLKLRTFQIYWRQFIIFRLR